jgi:hypothetical protein
MPAADGDEWREERTWMSDEPARVVEVEREEMVADA